MSSHNISYGHYVRLIHFQLFQFIMQIRLSRAGFNWILRKPSLLKYMFFLLPTVVWMTKKVWTADKSLLLHRTFAARTQNTRFAQVQIFITCIFPALSANKQMALSKFYNFQGHKVTCYKWGMFCSRLQPAAWWTCYCATAVSSIWSLCGMQAQWNAELENTASRFRRKCDPFTGIITKQRHTSDQNV